MKDQILEIAERLRLELITEYEAEILLLGLFSVRSDSSEKLEQAYKDGVRDALVKGYGTFDEENYS